jgi:hypothetical protein
VYMEEIRGEPRGGVSARRVPVAGCNFGRKVSQGSEICVVLAPASVDFIWGEKILIVIASYNALGYLHVHS